MSQWFEPLSTQVSVFAPGVWGLGGGEDDKVPAVSFLLAARIALHLSDILGLCIIFHLKKTLHGFKKEKFESLCHGNDGWRVKFRLPKSLDCFFFNMNSFHKENPPCSQRRAGALTTWQVYGGFKGGLARGACIETEVQQETRACQGPPNAEGPEASRSTNSFFLSFF